MVVGTGMPDDLAAQLRLLDSRLSNLDVRMALLENKVASTATDKNREDLQVRENNVPTRVALMEERVRGLNRIVWIILAAILTSALATNIQLAMIRTGVI